MNVGSSSSMMVMVRVTGGVKVTVGAELRSGLWVGLMSGLWGGIRVGVSARTFSYDFICIKLNES